MKYFKRLLPFFVVLVLLVLSIVLSMLFCTELKEGTIVDKRYEPEREWVQLVLMPTMAGKAMLMMPIPMRHFDDEDWVLTIEGEVDDKIVIKEVYTTEEEYNQFYIGDWYTLDSDVVFGDGIEKRRATAEEREKFGVLPADEDE